MTAALETAFEPLVASREDSAHSSLPEYSDDSITAEDSEGEKTEGFDGFAFLTAVRC